MGAIVTDDQLLGENNRNQRVERREVTGTTVGNKRHLDTLSPDPIISAAKQGSIVALMGLNEEIDNNTEEDLWREGGTYSFPTVAGTLSVVSDSANDALAGTGAESVQIQGLDASYNEITENVVLAGLTPVVTTNTFLRVNKMVVTSVGSGLSNLGIIRASRAGDVVSHIALGENIAEQVVYTVPTGKVATLIDGQASITMTKNSSGRKKGLMRLYCVMAGIRIVRQQMLLDTDGTSAKDINPKKSILFPAETDLILSFDSDSNNTRAVGGVDLIVEDA